MARVKLGLDAEAEMPAVGINEAMSRILGAGFGGLVLWWTEEGYQACCTARATRLPVGNTVLWNPQVTPEDAIAAIVHVAEREARIRRVREAEVLRIARTEAWGEAARELASDEPPEPEG